jgi:hypothetical protein
MVQLNASFPAPFSSYKKHYGFGKASRDYMNDPSVTRTGRHSPSEDAFFRHSPFKKKSFEVGQQNSLKERCLYVASQNNWEASPASYYGNISNIKPDVIYKNLTVKGRPKDPIILTTIPLTLPPENDAVLKQKSITTPSFTLKSRLLDTKLYNEVSPGPGAYETRFSPGAEMWPIILKGRNDAIKRHHKSPGAGQYEIKGDFDRFRQIPAGWKHKISK